MRAVVTRLDTILSKKPAIALRELSRSGLINNAYLFVL